MFLAGQEIKNPLASVIIIIYTKSEGGNVFLGGCLRTHSVRTGRTVFLVVTVWI